MAAQTAADDFIAALFGSRGQGKSATAKLYVKKNDPPRLLIWDPMDEYSDFAKVAPDLRTLVRCTLGGPFRWRFVPRGDPAQLGQKFEVFCRIAYAAGNLTVIVEELQAVTKPTWAPASWSDVTLRGRHKHIKVLGLSQRPASVDKNFFSNATYIQTGRVNFEDDAATMARVMRVSTEDILNLQPLEYIGRQMSTGIVSRGTIDFRSSVAGEAKKTAKAKK